MKGFYTFYRWVAFVVVVGIGYIPGTLNAQSSPDSIDLEPIEMPIVGSHTLRVLSPTLVELYLVNTKGQDPARVTPWDFVVSGVLTLPSASSFVVKVDGQTVPVVSVGFKRRVLFAPEKVRDLRIGNSLFLTLASPIGDNQTVEVTNPAGNVIPSGMTFVDVADPLRWNPAIHVNQVGYMPNFSKKAMVGYYLGSMGELDIAPGTAFQIVDIHTQAPVHSGQLTSRRDIGFTTVPQPYQKVLEADFTPFNTPGDYWLVVPGLGSSFPFQIHEGVAAAAARSYALGMYHQRCGTDNALPFTRHTHGVCHPIPAEIPGPTAKAWQFIAAANSGYSSNPRHTAPQLTSLATCLYPYNRSGPVNVVGGHHDAGDYSKYTINSALLIEALVFAADAFPGAGDLDNMGVPESGDGKSDLLQEAKWEADYLAKMQDTDGGFYFLCYPRDRKYENNILPDPGDPQTVWPKQTAVTASATAALAQIASSPRFKQQFPAEAALYMQKAQLGWNFLMQAIAQHGKDGSYQKVTHYGDTFMHDDEMAWAAASMFAATGDPQYQQKLMQWYPDPNDRFSTARWSWWRLYQGYGGAVRAIAFAQSTGRLEAGQMDAAYFLKCQNEIKITGQLTADRVKNCAYGTSFPDEHKRPLNPSWYFSTDRAFDIAAAHLLDPKPEYIDAVVSNINYEMGCNPVNVSFLTGIGWKRQRDIVHQYAQNDRRVLPPSGITLGNIMTGFQFLNRYKTATGGNELSPLSFPFDYGTTNPHALYDRWGDSFNTTTEFTVIEQARGMALTAFLMAKTPTKDQVWRSATAQVTGVPSTVGVQQPVTAGVEVAGIPVTGAMVVWETKDILQPAIGPTFTFAPVNSGTQWIEAEIQWPDGRRAFAVADVTVGTGGVTLPTVTISASDSNAAESGSDTGTLTISRTGSTSSALTVNYTTSGTAMNGSDYATLDGSRTIPAGAGSITVMVTPVADSTTEGVESVVVALSANAAYQIGSPNSGTVNIAADASSALPTVSIAASDPNASEVGSDSGVFTLSRTGDTSAALNVNYTMSGTASNGTDYASLGGSATIPAGASSTTVSVSPATDSNTEGTESAVMTISASAAYQLGVSSSSTVSIADDAPVLLPTLSVSASDATASEVGPDNGTFTITRTGSTSLPLAVTYSMSGSAVNGSDYGLLLGVVTIPAGSASATVSVAPNSDTGTEGPESAVLTLGLNPLYQVGSSNSATVTIADSPPATGETLVSISASDASAYESGGDNGMFTFARSGSTAASLLVKYSISGSATVGTDYQWLDGAWQNTKGSVTIPAGASSKSIALKPKSDSATEPAETVVVTVTAYTGYQVDSSSSATVILNDGAPGSTTTPTVSLSATDSAASESGGNGIFTITRTGSTSAALSVNYAMSGTASNGTDYSSLAGSATIPAGAVSVAVTLVPMSDASVETSENAIMTLSTSSTYQLGSPSSATISISDLTQPPPAQSTVSIAATDSSATESGGSGTFTLTRTGSTSSALIVYYAVGGTASNGSDYTALDGSRTIPAGSSSVTVTVTPVSDLSSEGTETCVLTLSVNSSYLVGSPSSATVSITNVAPPTTLPTVSVSGVTDAVESSSTSGRFTITRTGSTSASLTVGYIMSGTASGSDYSALSGSVTIPAGASSANVNVIPTQDGIKETTESVIMSIGSNSAYTLGGSSSASITIKD